VSQAEAVEQTIAALAGSLSDVDAGLVEAVRGLARAVDEFPDRAALWKELLAALARLRDVGAVVEDDGQAEIIELLRTPVGDAETA
jgi:hypothetical protein